MKHYQFYNERTQGFLQLTLHKISLLSLKMLRGRRGKLREKNTHESPFFSYILLRHYCFWQHLHFFCLRSRVRIATQDIKKKKSKNVLGSISLLEPNSITLTNWHKNKRLFQDNFSEARIIHTAPYNTS